MSQVPQREIYQKPEKEPDDPAHLALIRSMPCCLCYEHGLPQLSPTTAHHCIHGRYGNRKRPDSMAIPLCDGHHQGDFDKSKIAVHRHPERWKRLYGQDTDWISWVENRMKEME